MNDYINNKNCPVCGCSAWQYHASLPRIIFSRDYSILKCKTCGLGATDPQPTGGSEFYEENEKYSNLFDEDSRKYRKFAKELLSILDDQIEQVGGKRLLDIGCGGGYLVEEAAKKGFSAEGIEANIEVAERGRKRGLDIYTEDVEIFSASENKYDVIVLSAILEHVKDPVKLLNESLEMLDKSGLLIISQADYDGLLPKVFPWGWYGWQPEEHFWHFNKKSLLYLADVCGVELRKMRNTSLYHKWYFSGDVKTIAGRNLATLIARFGGLLKQGDSIEVIVAYSDK